MVARDLMVWQTLKNKQKIVQIFRNLLSEKKEIRFRIQGEKTEFTSRVIKLNRDNVSSAIGKMSSFIIEKLRPEKGNALIQSDLDVTLEFSVVNRSCRCPAEYIGINSSPPYFGFFFKIPESIEIEEKRHDERVTYETPDFVSAEFRLEKGQKGEKLYDLNVMDCSIHGLGLIITRENFDLLKKLKPGYRIKDMFFFATQAMVKIDGLVKHITKINEGKYKGSYKLGIESREIIENCKPSDD